MCRSYHALFKLIKVCQACDRVAITGSRNRVYRLNGSRDLQTERTNEKQLGRMN